VTNFKHRSAALDAVYLLLSLPTNDCRRAVHHKERSGSTTSASSVQGNGLQLLEASRIPQQTSSMTLLHRRPFTADAAADCAAADCAAFDGGLLAGTTLLAAATVAYAAAAGTEPIFLLTITGKAAAAYCDGSSTASETIPASFCLQGE
jgi:hypothetical protein